MGVSDTSYYMAMAIIPKISGGQSIIGSSFIIRDVIKHWRGDHRRGGRSNASRRNLGQRKLSATSRVILNMSVADILTSFWAHFLSTWMVPKSNLVVPLAAGNDATCKAQAFFYELFLYVGFGSNAFLALAFWLTICREKSETTLRQWKWQTLLLGFPWIIGLVNTLSKLFLGSSSFNGFWWCELVEGSSADNVLDQAVLLFAFAMITFCMVALMRFVYVREKKMDQFTTLSPGENHSREVTTQVTYQGIFYILAWVVIVIPSLPMTFMEDLPREYVIFWSFLFPLQGFANTLVYFRPKYTALRKRERNNGRGSGVVLSVVQVLDVTIPERLSQLASSVASSFCRSGGGSRDVRDNEQESKSTGGQILASEPSTPKLQPSTTPSPTTSMDPPLIWKGVEGCNPKNTCTSCQGDGNTDQDSASPLECFHRDDSTQVP